MVTAGAGCTGYQVASVDTMLALQTKHVPTLVSQPTAEMLQLDFIDIKFTVPARNRGGPARDILRGVNGRLRPGKLTAILGPSGAGKTSLLNILSGNRTCGASGRVLVNGHERSMATFRQQSVLIPQDFALLGALTVHENLLVAAQLKLDSSYSVRDRDDVVRDIADILGLESCLKTQVKNLSGGERKRLSIGLELVTNPPIMFFDEPTSGLDSVSSVQVVSHLRSLALSGRTVAVVVHQPSSRLFHLFDDLLVVAEGQSLYCGPVSQAVPTLAAAGFSCPSFYNLADFLIEVASGERGSNLQLLAVIAAHTAHDNDSHDETDSMLPSVKHTSVPFDVLEVKKTSAGGAEKGCLINGNGVTVTINKTDRKVAKCREINHAYSVSFWVQFCVLLRRSLLVTWRDLHMAWLRFAAHLLVGLMLGVLYNNIGNEASKISGNSACLFFFVLFLFFSNAMPTVLTFPLEAAVFFREYSNGWYTLRAYYFSKAMADLPFQLINPTAFLLVALHLTDQPTDNHRACMLWFVCVLTVLVAHSYGLVMGAAFNMQLGVFLVPASTIPLILFSGFFLYLTDIPAPLQWLSFVSNFRYSFEGAVACVYGMDRAPLKCSQPYCHWKNPKKFLEDIGMSSADYWFDMSALLVWFLVLQLVLVATLKIRVYLSRR